MKVIMQPEELELFKAFLSEADAYFEFGMGGSTCLAATLVKKRISAVDSDRVWVSKVRGEIGNSTKHVDLRHVDIGPTGAWGTPVSRENEHLFRSYSGSIVETGFRDFDLCLVDGRFRVACFLQALQFLRPGAIIGIHDYVMRPAYKIVEDFARPIASRQQLKFFVRRTDWNEMGLKDALEAHRLNWA
ncbi:hypothetical protein [Chelativorans xinjiangense]|uniref:hypothetical protein n=1 Tax=Chelativorans xinjiangense TaxID=2681485 RepID=UPI0013571DC4|nr:hypothetical protein [Chelativorans xinjiangense]